MLCLGLITSLSSLKTLATKPIEVDSELPDVGQGVESDVTTSEVSRLNFVSSSVTRLGDFESFLWQFFFTKVGQMYGRLFGIFWKHQFEVKTDVATFLGNLLKNWATFNFGIWSHRPEFNQVPFYLENSKLTLSVWVVAKYPWSSLVEGDEQPVRANCQTQMNDAVHVDISKFLVCYKHSSLPHGQFLLFISVY